MKPIAAYILIRRDLNESTRVLGSLDVPGVGSSLSIRFICRVLVVVDSDHRAPSIGDLRFALDITVVTRHIGIELFQQLLTFAAEHPAELWEVLSGEVVVGDLALVEGRVGLGIKIVLNRVHQIGNVGTQNVELGVFVCFWDIGALD